MIISSILSVIHKRITIGQFIQSLNSSKRIILYPLVPSNSLVLERPFFNQTKNIRIYLDDYKEEKEKEEELINLMDDDSNERVFFLIIFKSIDDEIL